MTIDKTLTLPCGQSVPNRLVKAALTEGLADVNNHATQALATLYGRWSDSGCGALLSGNILVDPDYLERPGNVVLTDDTGLSALSQVVSAAKQHGARYWAQLNHAGRQANASICEMVVGPSAVRGSHMPPGQQIRALSDAEVWQVIEAFGRTAALSMQAGFDGVQIHAAHGYLISSFLSPNANQRTDQWGGDIQARSRLLLEVVRAVRSAIGSTQALSVKLNSADFQRGGFGEDDALQVIRMLGSESVDFIEISGGTYETLGATLWDGLQTDAAKTASTAAREAYFLSFAHRAAEVSTLPLMLTGGFRSAAVMNQAIENDGLSLVGVGRPLIVNPSAARHWLDGTGLSRAELDLLRSAGIGWYYHAIRQLADGNAPDFDIEPKQASRLTRATDAAQAASWKANRSEN